MKESGPSGIVGCFLMFLTALYLAYVIFPVFLVWGLILGPREVNDMHREAMRMIDGEELGYCGLMIAYQRSEDV